jgi:hypothetical protein
MGFPMQCKCRKCGEQFYAYPDRRGSEGKYPKYCSRRCYLDYAALERKWRAEAAARKAEQERQAAAPALVLAALDRLHRWCAEHGHADTAAFAQAAAALKEAGAVPAPTE